MQKGKLELLMGPMRSNKTEELLRRVAMRREFAHQSVMLFKPSDDTKSALGSSRAAIRTDTARCKRSSSNRAIRGAS